MVRRAKDPRYIRHKTRPAWGVGVLVDENSETRAYLFADGSKRSFKVALCEEMIEAADPPGEEDQVRLSRGLATGGVATPKAINLELEQRILDSVDDPAPYLVYADWLQTRDDPRGALVPVQHRLLSEPDNKKLKDVEKKLLEEHGAYLLPTSLYATLRLPRRKTDDVRSRCEATWRLGFLEKVRLARRSRQQVEIDALVSDLLAHPSAHFLRSLEIGPLGDSDQFNYNTAVAAIAKAKHPTLAAIFIGDFDPDHIELSFSRAGNVSPLLSSTPRLERLTVRAGSLRFDSAIKHSTLKELRVITSEISRNTLDRLFEAALPELELLELSCPGPGARETIFRLLENRSLPRLRHLALRQTDGTSAILDAIAASPLLRQLESLELDGGDFSAPPGEDPRLAHLKHLDLSPRRAATPITEAEVGRRAPDAQSMTSARAIARPGKWMILGRDGDRLWGEYEGSDHYYVLARMNDPETSCTCPSPKDPCKHALALLLLAAAQHEFNLRPVPEELARQTRTRPRYSSAWE